jgi:hypothetical protein
MPQNADAREAVPGAAVICDADEIAVETTTTAVSGQAEIVEAVYGASTIKRFRRTKSAIVTIRESIHEVLAEANPQTVRQVFYALTVRGVIKKAEAEYQRTVVRLLTETREAGEIPFDWIADNTRWMRKPTTFTGLDACLKSTLNFYRRRARP